MGVSHALRGYAGSHNLKEFLKAWEASASHLDAQDLTATVKSALACYRLAQSRAPIQSRPCGRAPVSGSQVRRTEAVVSEIAAGGAIRCRMQL